MPVSKEETVVLAPCEEGGRHWQKKGFTVVHRARDVPEGTKRVIITGHGSKTGMKVSSGHGAKKESRDLRGLRRSCRGLPSSVEEVELSVCYSAKHGSNIAKDLSKECPNRRFKGSTGKVGPSGTGVIAKDGSPLREYLGGSLRKSSSSSSRRR